MIHQQKIDPRVEYRQQEGQRVHDSATLAEKFRELKSLTVHLAFFAPDGLKKISEMKCTFNLNHAKSLFRFDCPNPECVGGDFDLTAELTNGVAAHHATATGEAICQGWRSKTSIGEVSCRHILRYKLIAGY